MHVNAIGRRDTIGGLLSLGLVGAARGQAHAASVAPAWVTLSTEPYPQQAGRHLLRVEKRGWYGNGKGRLFATTDGGETWTKLLDRPGTFIRALGFADEQVGIMGNIGPGSFPDVTDATPLYRTLDGGRTWSAVSKIEGARSPPASARSTFSRIRSSTRACWIAGSRSAPVEGWWPGPSAGFRRSGRNLAFSQHVAVDRHDPRCTFSRRTRRFRRRS